MTSNFVYYKIYEDGFLRDTNWTDFIPIEFNTPYFDLKSMRNHLAYLLDDVDVNIFFINDRVILDNPDPVVVGDQLLLSPDTYFNVVLLRKKV